MKVTIFQDCLREQAHRHPALQPQDGVKLCYQAAYGAEHLLRDRDTVYRYFMEEFQTVPAADLPLYEQVCQDYARVNLAAWKYHQLPSEWLFQMFYLTASGGAGCKTDGAGSDDPADADAGNSAATDLRAETLCRYLDTVGTLAKAGELPFSLPDWQDFRRRYEENGGGAMHHSAFYREREYPAYRIIHMQYIRLIPMLQKLQEMPLTGDDSTGRPHDSDMATVIAIDGRAAAGKSTIAEQLAAILEGSIIHMDDFFLPPALRTDERLAEPGGNIHYERFFEEILPQIHRIDPLTYQVFDCSIMELHGISELPENRWHIVEGSYSQHPHFGNYADLRIFCDVDPQIQQDRILARNGEELLQRFIKEWIPMEERYFDTFGIREKSHLILKP